MHPVLLLRPAEDTNVRAGDTEVLLSVYDSRCLKKGARVLVPQGRKQVPVLVLRREW